MFVDLPVGEPDLAARIVIVVSNVPGPQQTFSMNGEPLREVYPAVPLNPATQGLNVGVMSYDGRIFFGLWRGCPPRPAGAGRGRRPRR
ncbi:MAG: WS/DGAT domain-containing protein [Solirubrobacteraceae bacterium]